jgi:hypothetical protein
MAPADTIIAVINRLSERSFVMFLAPQKSSAWRSVGGRNISQINLGTESQNFRLESQNLGTVPKISEKLITFPTVMRKKTMKKDQVRRSAETRRSRMADGT